MCVFFSLFLTNICAASKSLDANESAIVSWTETHTEEAIGPA